MEGQSKSPERRTLLQRGLVALAAGLGLGAGGRSAAAAPAAPPTPAAGVVVLRGRRRPASPQGRLPRGATAPRLVREGELVDDAGAAVGRFSSSSFCGESPFGPQIAAASSLELQAFLAAEQPPGLQEDHGAVLECEDPEDVLGGQAAHSAVGVGALERRQVDHRDGQVDRPALAVVLHEAGEFVWLHQDGLEVEGSELLAHLRLAQRFVELGVEPGNDGLGRAGRSGQT